MALDAKRVIERCRSLATITDVAGETTRTFLSPAMRACNDTVAAWMRDAGMDVRTDAAGNLRGLRLGASERTLIIASHLDTVPRAGAFDGILGVILGIELAANTLELPYSIEVIGFSEEEGVRFGKPFLGSRALVGEFDDALLSCTDTNGHTVRDAILAYGCDIMQLAGARTDNAFAYLEFHIEQGPLLEAEDLSLGIVTDIVGQSRYSLRFLGEANHAGTTPMHLRQDAMAAAAEWITRVESLAGATPDLVATVGSVVTLPGAVNVIAGEVQATLDVRSPQDSARTAAVESLLRVAEQCGARRDVSVETEQRMNQAAVPMNASLSKLLMEAAGKDTRKMVSGAGHDAMIVAPHIPSAMLFVRSPGGLSHHPDETVREQDVIAALETGARFLNLLARRNDALRTR